MIKKRKVHKDNVVKFPSKLSDIDKQIEAVIFAAAEPLDVDTIESKITKKTNVNKSLEKLQQEYSNRGINLVCIKNKWSFRTSPKLASLMTQEKTFEKKLSRAAVETLAIIVYHQPVTRAEIEEIRGVAFGTNTLEILMELDWVKPGGRKDVPGKPIQYLTTDGFLSHFNLQKLSDLPTVDELGAAGLIDSTSVDNAIFGSSKFFKEKQDEKKEDIYSNIDEMLSSTLEEEEKDS
jgi:segregation and condensation protein B